MRCHHHPRHRCLGPAIRLPSSRACCSGLHRVVVLSVSTTATAQRRTCRAVRCARGRSRDARDRVWTLAIGARAARRVPAAAWPCDSVSRLPLGSQQVADGLHDDGQLQLVARVSRRRPRADPRPDVHHLSSACEMGREPVRSRSAISRRGNVTGVELSAARQACAGALRRLPRSARPCPELHRRGDDLHRLSSRR